MDECHTLTVPSSDPDRMMGRDGWNMANETLALWDSSVWTQDLAW